MHTKHKVFNPQGREVTVVVSDKESAFDTNARTLLPFRRFRVVFHKDGERRKHSIVTLNGQQPTRRKFLGFPVITFTNQADGNVHVVAESLVDEIVIEQADRNGDWHEVGALAQDH